MICTLASLLTFMLFICAIYYLTVGGAVQLPLQNTVCAEMLVKPLGLTRQCLAEAPLLPSLRHSFALKSAMRPPLVSTSARSLSSFRHALCSDSFA